MSVVKAESIARAYSLNTEFVSRVCLPFLQSAQNEDGGWGFHPGLQSRVEATSWALLALLEQEAETAKALKIKGFGFLRRTQLQDGSWPASPEQRVGCWVTSLASWVILADGESRNVAKAGLGWVCEDWPRDISLIRRLIWRLKRADITRQNNALRGWGWTPRTASWVEPTAFALLALERAPKDLLPSCAAKRQQIGKLMICSRMCPGGGWNCGNPMVYGVPGDPSVGPTVWALLALWGEPDTEQKLVSLRWLEKNLGAISGAASIALAKICLEAYGRPWPDGASRFVESLENREVTVSVPVMALACLALGGWRNFLKTSEWP
jgi:hypothetical protein